MEMLPLGDLQRLLRQAPDNKLSILDVSAVLRQGLEALEYLHGSRVTHRDLKLANIMVNATISFAYAVVIENSQLDPLPTGIITARWMLTIVQS